MLPKPKPCPSSLVIPPARTYVVTQVVRDGSVKVRHIGLLYADRWTDVPQSAVTSDSTYSFQQLTLRLEEAWSTCACISGLCP